MNKRGNIAMWILILVSLIVAVAIPYTFYTFNSSYQASSEKISQNSLQISFLESYISEKTKVFLKEAVSICQNCPPEQLANKISSLSLKEPKIAELGNFHAKLRNSEFTLTKNNNIQLEIQNIFIQTESPESKVKKEFTLCQTFSLEGEFLSDC